jgi:uncharacterized membrane protein
MNSHIFTEKEKATLFSNVFKFSMIWRIVYGFIKTISGLALLRIITLQPFSPIFRIGRHSFFFHPDNFIIEFINSYIHRFPISTALFISFYLIFWGVVDTFLSFYILKKQIWAYPIALVLIFLFTIYEIYRYTHTHSPFLLLIIFIDIAIFFIIKKELDILKRLRNKI